MVSWRRAAEPGSDGLGFDWAFRGQRHDVVWITRVAETDLFRISDSATSSSEQVIKRRNLGHFGLRDSFPFAMFLH